MIEDKLKSQRKLWIEALMARNGYPEPRGRAAAIRKATGANPGTINGWLRGSLPNNLLLAAKFCKAFDTDVESWAYATDKPPVTDYRQEREIRDAVMKAKRFEEETGHLTPETFVEVFSVIYKEARGEMSLEDALGLFQYTQEQKNGTECE